MDCAMQGFIGSMLGIIAGFLISWGIIRLRGHKMGKGNPIYLDGKKYY